MSHQDREAVADAAYDAWRSGRDYDRAYDAALDAVEEDRDPWSAAMYPRRSAEPEPDEEYGEPDADNEAPLCGCGEPTCLGTC